MNSKRLSRKHTLQQYALLMACTTPVALLMGLLTWFVS